VVKRSLSDPDLSEEHWPSILDVDWTKPVRTMQTQPSLTVRTKALSERRMSNGMALLRHQMSAVHDSFHVL
jgi:hypothetical protein